MLYVVNLFNLRLQYQPDSLPQHPGKDLPRAAEECDPPVVGTHVEVSQYNNGVISKGAFQYPFQGLQ